MNKKLQHWQKNININSHPIFIKRPAWKVSLFPFQFLLALVFIFSTAAFEFKDINNNDLRPAEKGQSLTHLRVGVYNFKPIIFMGEDGTAQGLYIDVLNYIARQENWSLEFVPCTFAVCLAKVESGELDILPSVGITEERAKKLDYSDEFLFMDWGVVYQNKTQLIETVLDVEGKRIAALKGSIFTEGFTALLDQFSVRAEIIEKDEYSEVLAAVNSGEADAGIVTRIYGLELEDNYRNVQQTDVFFSPVKIYFALPKGGNPVVLETLNKNLTALKADKNSPYYQSLNKWMDFYHKGDGLPITLIWGLIGLTALIVALLLFTFLLRRQVTARTRSLEREVQERRQAEEKLLNIQVLLQACIESPQSMIIMAIDRGYNYLTFNATHKASMQYAYGRDVEIGVNILESITSDEDREKAKQNYDRAMSGKSHSTVEVYGDVDRAYYESFYNPIYNEQREIIGVTAFAMDITGRKQAEAALRESEMRFRSVLEKISLIGLMLDLEGRVTLCNDFLLNLSGWDREEVLNQNWFEMFLPPEIRNEIEAEIFVKSISSGEIPANYVNEILTRPGSRKLVQWNNMVLHDQNGSVIGVASIGEDITARKQAEAEKRKVDAQLRTLSAAIEQSPVTTVITDLDGTIVFVNPKFTETTGYTAEEAIGQNPRILKTNFKPRSEYKELWDTILSGQIWHGIFQNKKKNGAHYWESATISPVKDEHGAITHFLAVKENITERKKAEEALRENQRFLSQLIENNGAIIFAKDRAGRYELVNKKWEDEAGVRRDFAIGKTDAQIFPGQISAEHHQSDLQVIESKGVVKTEDTFRGVTGNRFYATIKFPLLDANNEVKGVCGVTTDITERRQAEEELRESRTLFHLLIESLPQNIYVKDTNGRFIFANQHYCATEGKPLEEILGKTDFELHPLELAQKYLLDDRRVIETGTTVEVVEEHQPIGGEKTFVQVIKTPFHFFDGNAAGVLGIFWDVTERKQAEDALQQSAVELELFNRQLEIAVSNANEMAAQAFQAEAMIRESEARYRAVVDSASDAIISANGAGIIFSWNHGAETIFGYPESEAVGLTLTLLMPPHFQDMHLMGMERLQAGGDKHIIGKTVEVEGQRRDGSVFPLEISLAEWSVGNDRFFTAMIRDITERKQLEDELHYQATMDGLTGVINRRHFQQLALAELKRAIRLGHPLTIVLIDIDHFKHVNDTYGHAAGDQALLTFTTICQKNIREIDIFSRFGGDEFALLLPEANSQQAYTVIERIRLAIATEPISLDGKLISLTISSGIASLSDAAEEFDKLLIKADQALYRAKEAGRNKIVGHDE